MVTSKRGIEFNIDDIATDLNGKMDKDGLNATCPMIVETYHNGTDWYRVWSDGWCEQGGVVPFGADVDYTGSLLKAYKDTNYQIGFTTLQYNTSAYATQWQYIAIYPISNTTFGCKAINFTRGWEAKGYIS